MTEKMPDDRELEQYLAGGSKLSARYREASAESAPPELDEAILARARAEARRKPDLNRYLAPVALAASLVLAVNLGWNLFEAEKQARSMALDAVTVTGEAEPAPAREPAAAPEAPAVTPQPPMPSHEPRVWVDDSAGIAEPRERAEQAAKQAKAEIEERAAAERKAAAAPPSGQLLESYDAPAAALAQAPRQAEPLGDSQKIDRLIAHIGQLEGAVFIRNGKEYGPAEAAKHLAYKRRKAGDRVKTPDDFIRLCASHSYLSGEAYLIRFNDGRTRTAEDVLREELAKLEGLR
jgi:hypothetical protein